MDSNVGKHRIGTSAWGTRGGKAALLLWALLALLVGTPGAAFAHAKLEQTSPAKGEQLNVAPKEIRLTFNEAVELALARIVVVGPTGEVALAPLELAPRAENVAVARIEGPLQAGTYTVSWQVAGGDSHPIRGEYTFSIATGASGVAATTVLPPAPGAAPPPAAHHPAQTFPAGSSFSVESPLYDVVRWLNFLGLLGMTGAVAFRLVLVVVRRQEPQLAASLVAPAAARAARFGLWMAGIAGLATLLRLYAQSYALHGGENALAPDRLITLLNRTLWGWGWWLEIGAVVVASIGFLLASRARSTNAATGATIPAETVPLVLGPEEAGSVPESDGEPSALPADTHTEHGRTMPAGARSVPAVPGWALAAVGVLAAAFTPGMSGHAAASPKMAPLPIITDGLHVLGAGGWLGSLLVLLLIGIPVALRLAPRDRGPGVAVLVNAFSPTALFFAGTVVGTGVFAAWLHLGSVPALWESAYGKTLLLKLGILSVVFATGAYNWLRVKPALGEEVAAGRLRRSATLELAIGTVVLAVTAVLVATATPSDMAGMEQTAHRTEVSAPTSASAPGSVHAGGHE